MNVGIIGTGHVGLPTAAVLASLGHSVVATDSDREKIAALRQAKTPFFEPGLDELVSEGMAAGRLTFTEEAREAVEPSDAVLICVGTPPRADGEANLLAVEHAAEVVGQHARGRTVIVEKSTVPTGTAERIAEWIDRDNPQAEIALVCNPEFLREGSAVEDSFRPSRILVGASHPWAFEVMRELYAPMIEAGATVYETDLRTAELSKHASNAFLALKVSFANALARVCELAGADVVAVTEAMALDDRIGPGHLRAGLGFGGSCFPKDLAAFERLTARLGYEFPILREVARINDEALDAAFAKVQSAVWNLEGKRIALLGLAFKPDTDDVRFSPALGLARRLLGAGAHVVGYDPQAGENAREELPDLQLAVDPYTAVSDAHCAVICTQWNEFAELHLGKVHDLMRRPVIVDGRNMFDPASMAQAGFTYIPTGRPAVRPAPTAP